MRFPVKQLRIDGEGIAKVLGELEAEIMDALWTRRHATVGDVRADLRSRKEYSFNTIMTVMNRLVEKGVLAKSDARGVFSYRPAVTRERFRRDVTRSVLAALLHDGSLFHAAGFAEALRGCTAEERALLEKIVIEERS
jgi:predicted transcriptional regulator